MPKRRNKELPWIATARAHIGLHEIKGRRHNKTILSWLKRLRAWWSDDETPWCGSFVAEMLTESGRYVVKHWYRAKAWANAAEMTRLNSPAYGCIVVFSRRGGGHVGFVVGKQGNKICVLGGNQNDEVNIKAFGKRRVVGYYWPSRSINKKPVKSRPNPGRYNLKDMRANKAGKLV